MQTQEAEEHLRIIRSLMEKATIYRAIPAPTALVAGLLAVAAAVGGHFLSLRVYEMTTGDHYLVRYSFPLTWLAVLTLVAIANGFFLYRDARRRGEKFISHGMKMALIALLPSHLTAAVLSVAFGSIPVVLAIVWILCHGVGLLATGHFSPRSILVLGWGFLLAGLATVAVAIVLHDSFRPSPHLLMGVTFGGFHLIYAACTWPRGGAKSKA